jgi:integrase
MKALRTHQEGTGFMGVHTWKGRHGGSRLVVSKTWPDGKRLRVVVPTRSAGNKLLTRVEESIVMGTWRDFRQILSRPEEDPTIQEFSKVYLEQYCRTRNRRVDFKQYALVAILRRLGRVKVREVSRRHGLDFQERRAREVAPATVNREFAVLRNLMTYARDRGIVDRNPLLGIRSLKEPPRAPRTMTVEERAKLVECVGRWDEVIAVLVVILSECALRLGEGLNLRWSDLDLKNRMLTLERTKAGRTRRVPLSTMAVEALMTLPRSLKADWVFLRDPVLGLRWKDPRGPFHKGREEAGLTRIGFHDLRHFRATQWVRHGVDIRTVQELLGHSSIVTTQRYAHFVQAHAFEEVRRVEREEKTELGGIVEAEEK